MLTSALVLLAGLLPLAAADTDAWTRMETTFRDVPMEARRLTGPLFWLHGDDKETPERLRLFLDKVKEGGNLLDIAVLDHIILTNEGYYSFADEGLL